MPNRFRRSGIRLSVFTLCATERALVFGGSFYVSGHLLGAYAYALFGQVDVVIGAQIAIAVGKHQRVQVVDDNAHFLQLGDDKAIERHNTLVV